MRGICIPITTQSRSGKREIIRDRVTLENANKAVDHFHTKESERDFQPVGGRVNCQSLKVLNLHEVFGLRKLSYPSHVFNTSEVDSNLVALNPN